MFHIGVIFVLITVVGILGNVLVLAVIALNTQLHESTSIFICNLAAADLLFLVFCVPLTALSYLRNSWPFPDELCYVTVTLQYVTCYVSVWTLVLLAHDRFISITSPSAGRSLRRTRAVGWICAAVWGIVLALNSLQMRNVGVFRFQLNGTVGSACVDSLEIALARASLLEARLFYWGFNLGAYLLPLALSCVFYLCLLKEIWKQKMVHTKSSQKMKRHATRMVFVVILTFGFCWFPQNLRFFLQGLNYPDAIFWERDQQTLVLVQSIVQTLAYANSCVNPILYGLLSERFRQAFRRTLSRLLCGSPLGPNASVPFPASFGGFSTAKNSPAQGTSAKSSKRPSSALVGAANERKESPRRSINGGPFMSNGTGGCGGMLDSLSSRSSLSPIEEERRRGSQTILLTNWRTNSTVRLEPLGEERTLILQSAEQQQMKAEEEEEQPKELQMMMAEEGTESEEAEDDVVLL